MNSNKEEHVSSGRLDTGKNSQESTPSTFSRDASDVASKSLYIKTFGCQMNDRDSEALLGLFLERGYGQAQSVEEADVILINTCSVREHAEDRAISYAGSLKKLFAKLYPLNAKPVIGLIGCMARNRGEELFKKMPHIDLICGPASFPKIPQFIEKILEERARILDLNDGLRDEEMYRAAFRMEPNHAQVVISTGCSNYCSYCVVPYVRGPLRVRSLQAILDEVKRNVDLGIKKITLLGQNVNDYVYLHKIVVGARPASPSNKIDFVDLLREVAKLEGVEELNFITSQPRNTSRELFEFMASSSKISKHLHLPVQSGSNRILELMNRGYTREHYLRLVNDYYTIVKGTLSTDIIVGFPGEENKDFLQTKEIVETVRFSYAYIFKYSLRMKARSAEFLDNISKQVKQERHKVLLDLQKSISLELKSDSG